MRVQIVFLGLFLTVFLGCEPQLTEKKASSDVPSILMRLNQTPDSLLTAEERSTIKKLKLMVAKYVEQKDGEFSFKLSKEEFVKKTNLDIMYYDAIMKDINEVNSMKDEMDIQSSEMDFKETQEKLLKELEEAESVD